MKDLKLGEWATCDGYTFVIVKIGDYCIPVTTYEEEAYFDIYADAYIIYHCERATQEDIERVCGEYYDGI